MCYSTGQKYSWLIFLVIPVLCLVHSCVDGRSYSFDLRYVTDRRICLSAENYFFPKQARKASSFPVFCKSPPYLRPADDCLEPIESREEGLGTRGGRRMSFKASLPCIPGKCAALSVAVFDILDVKSTELNREEVRLDDCRLGKSLLC